MLSKPAVWSLAQEVKYVEDICLQARPRSVPTNTCKPNATHKAHY